VSGPRDTPVRITPWIDLVREGRLSIEAAVDLAFQASGLLDERRRRDPAEREALEEVRRLAHERADARPGRAA
jgi:hypothetical protein